MRKPVLPVLLITFAAVLAACSNRQASNEQTGFTEIDTLTETYLMLEDSLLNTWNTIAHDENEKLKALHELLNDLQQTRPKESAQLLSLQQRLDQLEQMRFTMETMEESHLVDEYDFTSNSLISEITTLVESDPDFPRNTVYQALVDKLKIADQHISIYRTDYDSIASIFNRFLDKNKSKLIDLDESLSQKKRPLF
jgi:hypothetical protein